jgi:hypothetical protein
MNTKKYYEGNVFIIEFESWFDFQTFIQSESHFDVAPGVVFRGQRDASWRLTTTLDRALMRLPKKIQTQHIVDYHFEEFKKRLRGRRGMNPAPITNPDEYWALGQHFGLATPLLDWTHSPFVAAFFAFVYPENPSSNFRSIWALYFETLNSKAPDGICRIKDKK